MNLDVFNSDAFHMIPLSQAISTMPFIPTRIRQMGLFSEMGVPVNEIMIEREDNVMNLVPAAPRGAPGAVTNLPRRTVRKIGTVHLPQRVQIFADEVLGLRAFGSQTDEEVAMARLRQKMALARQKLDLTIEWQRMGAVKGKVLDADATTVLLDVFAELGYTQQTLNMNLDVTSTKVRSNCVAVSRMVEDELGGMAYSDIEVMCSAEFFDALVDHTAVSEAWKYASAGSQALTGDVRPGFQFGNLTFREYRGKVGATRFVEAGCAYAVPMGVPELFVTNYGPANYMDAVGTDGLPYYAQIEPMDFNKGIDVETQSNPLNFCTRPRAVVKLGLNAAALA